MLIASPSPLRGRTSHSSTLHCLTAPSTAAHSLVHCPHPLTPHHCRHRSPHAFVAAAACLPIYHRHSIPHSSPPLTVPSIVCRSSPTLIAAVCPPFIAAVTYLSIHCRPPPHSISLSRSSIHCCRRLTSHSLCGVLKRETVRRIQKQMTRSNNISPFFIAIPFTSVRAAAPSFPSA